MDSHAPDAPPRHSEDWFGPWRDHWWNRDFLALMATRRRLGARRRVLDVGAGVGHWGRALAPFLAPDAVVVGLEREPDWVARASEAAAAHGLAGRFSYVQGDAQALPFPDASFDAVTCQTVLMHLPDVPRALAEMRRVLAPGGLVAVVEPNNRANAILEPSCERDTPIDERLAIARLAILLEQGKGRVGEGYSTIAEHLPALVAAAGFTDVQVFLGDKATAYVPPYTSALIADQVAELEDIVARELHIADRATSLRYYLAAGGDAATFSRDWEAYLASQRRALAAFRAGTYASAGGQLVYLVSAHHPG